MCFIIMEIMVYSLCKANIYVSDTKTLKCVMASYLSTQVHSEQTRLVWLYTERSMLIFALWWPMIVCVYLLGYKGRHVLESLSHEDRR